MIVPMVILPEYHTLAQIYDGVNSRVYRAQHRHTKKTVILKCLKVDYPTTTQLTRYRQEYQLLRSLNSDRVIKAYALENYQRSLVLVLEDFDAISLKEWKYKNKTLPIEQFLIISKDIVSSLSVLHENKIIHKDINPNNIGINSKNGEIKILDLGISTEFMSEKQALKHPSQIDGTLQYISPEQTGRMNRILDYRTDFYSLGITFYELLIGQPPFTYFDPLELVHCQIAKIPPGVTFYMPSYPKFLSDIVMKMMAKNAEDRYQSVKGLQADLNYFEKIYQKNKASGFEFSEFCPRKT